MEDLRVVQNQFAGLIVPVAYYQDYRPNDRDPNCLITIQNVSILLQ